jgi:hypothetical protein
MLVPTRTYLVDINGVNNGRSNPGSLPDQCVNFTAVAGSFVVACIRTIRDQPGNEFILFRLSSRCASGSFSKTMFLIDWVVGGNGFNT